MLVACLTAPRWSVLAVGTSSVIVPSWFSVRFKLPFVLTLISEIEARKIQSFCDNDGCLFVFVVLACYSLSPSTTKLFPATYSKVESHSEIPRCFK